MIPRKKAGHLRLICIALIAILLPIIVHYFLLIRYENQIKASRLDRLSGDVTEEPDLDAKLSWLAAPCTPLVQHSDDFEMVEKATENQGIGLTVVVKRDNVLGKPIFIKVSLDNRRSDAIFLSHIDTLGGFYFELVDGFKSPVPRTAEGKNLVSNIFDIQNSSAIEILSAHHSYTQTCDILNYFTIQRAGTYTLSVVRRIRGTARHPLTGDDLDVHVDHVTFHVQ